jgi:hypothetical protein
MRQTSKPTAKTIRPHSNDEPRGERDWTIHDTDEIRGRTTTPKRVVLHTLKPQGPPVYCQVGRGPSASSVSQGEERSTQPLHQHDLREDVLRRKPPEEFCAMHSTATRTDIESTNMPPGWAGLLHATAEPWPRYKWSQVLFFKAHLMLGLRWTPKVEGSLALGSTPTHYFLLKTRPNPIWRWA